MKRQSSTGMGSAESNIIRRRSRKWFLLLLIIPLIPALIAGGVFLRLSSKYNKDVYVSQEYVEGWDNIPDASVDIEVTQAPENYTIAEPTDIPDAPPQLKDIEGNNDPIILVDPIDPDVENILLIGIDAEDVENEGHRSDTMMIVSINKNDNTAKMVSVMRDIWVYYPNRNAWSKINASYAYGGPGQTVNIINSNFGLDIQEYIVIDFTSFRALVDLIGGVQIKLSEKEAEVVPDIAQSGTTTLNGKQALAYSRIRKIDSDFVRVERQRTVLVSIFKSMRKMDPSTQFDVVTKMLEYMRSNIPSKDITGRLMDLALQLDESLEQSTIPGKGMYTVHNESTWYMSLNWDKQNEALHDFLYGAVNGEKQ
ncbi:MAG: LCP family protein [Clostridiaceae bacterium]|nr:LCP family protein [Clostridiaceae bacterium]